MYVWKVDAIYPNIKKISTVGVVFDKEIAKLLSKQSNEEVIYVYHREAVCGKLFACDKNSWIGRQSTKGDT